MRADAVPVMPDVCWLMLVILALAVPLVTTCVKSLPPDAHDACSSCSTGVKRFPADAHDARSCCSTCDNSLTADAHDARSRRQVNARPRWSV